MDDRIAPPLLMTSEDGSYAAYTVTQRMPQIIANVIAHHPYPPEIVRALRSLADELATSVVAPLRETAADAAFWRQAWEPWAGRTWRQVAWFFAEAFFYRRLLEATRYFQPGPWYLADPFEPEKRAELLRGLEALAAAIPPPHAPAKPLAAQFAHWLRRSLWGNRADLSNIAARAHADRLDPEADDDRLLIDHTADLWQRLNAGHVRRLDLIADNGGAELLADLALLDVLLAHDLVREVHLHLKGQPYFVSDAMAKDLWAAWHALRAHPLPALRDLGARLEAARDAGQLVIQDHPFWTTHLSFRALPDDLRAAWRQSDLLLFKGDVNYRRLVGDRHWPFTADLTELTRHMPAPLAILRTLKSELIVGLAPGQAEALAQRDADWLISGAYGVIQCAPRLP